MTLTGLKKACIATVLAATGMGVTATQAQALGGLNETNPEGAVTIMGTCGSTFSPSVPGAQAYWEVQCFGGGYIRIAGWVKDTRSDGKCAKVKAIYEDGYSYFSPAACPNGNKRDFTSPIRHGKNINAYLYTYSVG
jgi:hypothetical protein